ncbi:helix-turn-helix domain-containing protein [Bacteroides thetaiotaomicron]|uniref:AraC family transcriptional regulator n=1 Tax=Bacteroides thetaiotaomicron TaxID=818 RepID=A0A174VVN1_BACT4|nr:helix-turn-helix domain-containing protein [Bacteroides thetaiotaomicron]CUQ36228.1 AraC family transcriptional regulator [Bacteroides thetaiotaomicron]
MEENTKEMIVIDNVDRYNEIFGLETRHPLVSIIDLAKSTTWPTRAWFRYEVYALYLKNVKCGDIKYGRQYYDYQDGTIVCFAPGQITDLEMLPNIQPNAHGILFHPDLIRGTALGQEIKKYSFFSYEINEALHISEEERQTVMDCLQKITIELEHSIDKHSRRLICANIGLLLDYCMRFYERQFDTRNGVNKDIIVRFEHLLNEYFEGDAPQKQGLPSVKYFADKVFLSANYFSDMVRKQTGKTVSEYIQDKMIGLVKEQLLSTDKTTSQIAYEIGFQYPQHLSRMFKRIVGMTPNKFRLQS